MSVCAVGELGGVDESGLRGREAFVSGQEADSYLPFQLISPFIYIICMYSMH